jgi:hypothetical protein
MSNTLVFLRSRKALTMVTVAVVSGGIGWIARWWWTDWSDRTW